MVPDQMVFDALCPAVSEAAHCFTKWLQVTIVPPLRGLP